MVQVLRDYQEEYAKYSERERRTFKDVLHAGKKITKAEIRSLVKQIMAEILRVEIGKYFREYGISEDIVKAEFRKFSQTSDFRRMVADALNISMKEIKKEVSNVALEIMLSEQKNKKKPSPTGKSRSISL